MVQQLRLVFECDILFISWNVSSFGTKHLLGVLLHLMKIHTIDRDAAGQPLQMVNRRTLTLSCTEVTDKLAQDIRREDGSLFPKEVPFQLVKQMMFSGHLWFILNHKCCFVGMDRGTENVGCGRGQEGQSRRNAFIGSGSPLDQIFLTREAIDAVMNDGDWAFLRRVMEFIGVPECERTFEGKRAAPRRLSTRTAVKSLEFNFQGEIVKSRVSMPINPLSAFPMVEGGCPTPIHCYKHIISRMGTKYTQRIEELIRICMMVVSEIRYAQNHTKLAFHFNRVLGVEKNGKPTQWHVQIAESIGQERLNILKRLFPTGLTRQLQGCDSRWNTLQRTVRDIDRKREVLAAVFPIALGRGSQDERMKAGTQVLSKEGFQDEKKFAFSKKIGSVFFCLTEPSYILFIAITSFIYAMAWQPLLSAAASHGECSTKAFSGMESILRVVNYVLRRGCFVEINFFCYVP